MNECYSILHDGRVIDVVWGLSCCIGQQSKIERLNEIDTERRIASREEQHDAHRLQNEAKAEGYNLG